jgi:hypothetical protein
MNQWNGHDGRLRSSISRHVVICHPLSPTNSGTFSIQCSLFLSQASANSAATTRLLTRSLTNALATENHFSHYLH